MPETAELLRRHPPGVHMGPAAAAMERDRFRGKRGETPELARAGEATERGELSRAKAAEGERIRGELELVAARLSRAREEERRAASSVSAARSAGLSDGEIVAVYEKEESATGRVWLGGCRGGSGIPDGAEERGGSRRGASGDRCRIMSFWLARERSEDPVVALEEAVSVFEEARAVLLSDEQIRRLWGEAESGTAGERVWRQ